MHSRTRAQLGRLVRALRDRGGGPGAVAVTASTGAAACLVGGVTLHAFAGIGLGAVQRARQRPLRV